MEYTIYKKTIQSPPKDFNYCYETPSKSGTSQYSLTFIGNSSATSKQTNTQPGAL